MSLGSNIVFFALGLPIAIVNPVVFGSDTDCIYSRLTIRVGSSAVAGAGMEIEVWNHDFTNSQGQVYHWTGEQLLTCYPLCMSYSPFLSGQFSRVACLPIVTDVQGPGSFFSEQFINIVPGITDPDAFIPDSACL